MFSNRALFRQKLSWECECGRQTHYLDYRRLLVHRGVGVSDVLSQPLSGLPPKPFTPPVSRSLPPLVSVFSDSGLIESSRAAGCVVECICFSMRMDTWV